MTELLRRLLSSLATVAISGALLFVGLSMVAQPKSATLPLVFNPSPTSSSSESESVFSRLETGQSLDPEKVEHLGVVLALFAIPRLGGLSVAAQEELLLGLRPVRERIGDVALSRSPLDRTAEPRTLDVDLAFWKRFVEERAIDFRPPVRSRIVRRWLSGGLEMRRNELIALDTYALPELVQSLGTVRVEDDVRRVRQLARAISRLTEQRWDVPPNATVQEGARVASEIRGYWDRNGRFLLDASALAMLAESVRQTEVFLAVTKLVRGIRGIDLSYPLQRALGDVWRVGPSCIFGMLGGFIIGPLIASLLGLARVRRPSRGRSTFEIGLSATLLLSLALGLDGRGSMVVRLCFAALFPALSVALLLTADLHERLEYPVLRVLQKRRLRHQIVALLEGFGPAFPVLLPVLTLEITLLPLALPWTKSHPSVLGQVALALESGELEYPLIVGLSLATTVALLQVLAEPVRGALGRGLGGLT
jgi:hypothetical protein